MRHRLPNVNQVVADVKAAVAQSRMVKEASAPVPNYEVPLAQNLYKISASLRSSDFVSVTYEDVFALSKALLRS